MREELRVAMEDFESARDPDSKLEAFLTLQELASDFRSLPDEDDDE